MSLVDFIYVLANQNTDERRERIMLDTTKTIFYHFKLVVAGFSCGAAVYSLYPVYDYFFNGNLTPVSPMIFPFADDGTMRSYWIAMVCNFASPWWNIFGAVATSCIFMTFVDVYGGLVLLIENDLKKFDAMWTRKCNKKLRAAVFRNIMMEIMDLAR